MTSQERYDIGNALASLPGTGPSIEIGGNRWSVEIVDPDAFLEALPQAAGAIARRDDGVFMEAVFCAATEEWEDEVMEMIWSLDAGDAAKAMDLARKMAEAHASGWGAESHESPIDPESVEDWRWMLSGRREISVFLELDGDRARLGIDGPYPKGGYNDDFVPSDRDREIIAAGRLPEITPEAVSAFLRGETGEEKMGSIDRDGMAGNIASAYMREMCLSKWYEDHDTIDDFPDDDSLLDDSERARARKAAGMLADAIIEDGPEWLKGRELREGIDPWMLAGQGLFYIDNPGNEVGDDFSDLADSGNISQEEAGCLNRLARKALEGERQRQRGPRP